MQCQIRGMAEASEAGRPPPDTLPRSGRVNEVCREWLVHEDGALAYRLQKEEVDQHLSGNKHRNAVVRQDTPLAKWEQKREEEEAIARLAEERMMQEELDSNIALKLAERLEREEERRRQARLERDAVIARRIHEREYGAANCIGLPVPAVSPTTSQTTSPTVTPTPPEFQMRQLEISYPPPSVLVSDLQEDEARRIQEEKDAELARKLQEEEQGVPDRLLAIEAQDEELARMLQEKEKAKMRRAKERAKQKALLKKQLQQATALSGEEEENCYSLPHSSADPHEMPMTAGPAPRITKSRFPDPEAIDVILPSGDIVCVSTTPPSDSSRNIAVAIDPTYPRKHSQSRARERDRERESATPPSASASASLPTSPTLNSPALPTLMSPMAEESDTCSPTPPYMPVQGQRRISSLEKKNKKKSKDGCKQQ